MSEGGVEARGRSRVAVQYPPGRGLDLVLHHDCREFWHLVQADVVRRSQERNVWDASLVVELPHPRQDVVEVVATLRPHVDPVLVEDTLPEHPHEVRVLPERELVELVAHTKVGDAQDARFGM